MELQCKTCSRLFGFSKDGWKTWKDVETNCEDHGLEHIGGGPGKEGEVAMEERGEEEEEEVGEEEVVGEEEEEEHEDGGGGPHFAKTGEYKQYFGAQAAAKKAAVAAAAQAAAKKAAVAADAQARFNANQAAGVKCRWATGEGVMLSNVS
jgi:hypothetical protein